MKLPRRQFLQLAGAAAASLPHGASALDYPTRPVHLVVGTGPGTPVDVIARLIAPALSARLHQPVIVENQPGANGNTAAEAVASSVPDGHTLLIVGGANAINATLYENTKFDLLRDIAPVAGLIRTPLIVAVSPSGPAKTIPELISYAKANPGKLKMAANNAGPQHLAGEQFKIMAGIDMMHVHYRDEPLSLAAVADDQAQVTFATMAVGLDAVRAGKVRVLAVTTATRSDVLPDVPTVGEFVPGYVTFGFAGIGAPRSTSGEVIALLNHEINATLDDPAIKASLAERTLNPFHGSPADFGQLIADVIKMWRAVAKASGVKP